MAAGCAGTPAPDPALPGTPPAGDGRALSEAGGARQLQAAQRMMRAGEYSQAIPRLVQVTNDFAGTDAATDAWYFLGVAYYEISGYSNAVEYFREYLGRAPGGRHVEEARSALETIANGTPRALARNADDSRIETARKQAASAPDNLAYALDLANLLWEAGRYAEAGEVYRGLLPRWPRLENDMTLRSRMERQADGTYLILTPEVVAQRLAEAQPLILMNTASFTSGRGTLTARSGKDIYYNVTGEALNRSSAPLKDVRVFVTIFGLGSVVYDTQTVYIGSLAPGARRAFSVRFSNFENLDNVARYACEGTFER
jgi:tetratricopeptide (TPR) repeat protein